MIDVHCHLNFKAFTNDYDQVIKGAFEAGVTKIINVGTKIDSSKRAVELAEKYKNLYAIVGVHPHHADTVKCHPEFISGSRSRNKSSTVRLRPNRFGMTGKQHKSDAVWIEQIEMLARNPKVVAIGEIGMDNYRYQSNSIVDPTTQKEIFIKQIELAHKLKLPLQIHNRQAGKDILDILINHKSYLLNLPGMFHCFSGNVELLTKVLDLGFYVGFDGNITYEGIAKGEDTLLSDLIKEAPLERIVLETDSPYLTPEPHRGSRNLPEYVILIARFLADLKKISFDKVVAQTTQNANLIFKLDAKS